MFDAFSGTEPRFRSRGYLPHAEAGSVPQHIVFWLHDSLPREILERWAEELEQVEDGEERRAERMRRIEAALDAGSGSCLLRRPEVARIVRSSLLKFDGQRYWLHAWCIMPNHVHALVTPAPAITLSALLHTWKSFSAKQANRVLGRSGAFWMQEYFDRFIRDERHFVSVVEYIHNNPVAAGLCASAADWPFSSATRTETRA
jgi:REP element-mobilizing transposase RayT